MGWKDKSPGVKILWIWTFGTAAVLVTNVVRTRIRDMDQLIKSQSQSQNQQQIHYATDSIITDHPSDSNFKETSEDDKL